MFNIIRVTLKGIFRDRVLQGILVTALFFLLIPTLSLLSARQVTELSITLSHSLLSFLLVVLAIFLGGTILWRDIERRYSFSVLSLPISRTRFFLGRFAGLAIFLVITAILLGCATIAVVYFVSGHFPPDRPIAWGIILLSISFDLLKCMMIVAFALLFSSISSSFFLPIFGSIAIFLVGGVTQQVYDYINSSAGKELPQALQKSALTIYYILPNFSAFNLKVNAIYGIPVNVHGILLTVVYFVLYTAIILLIGALIFSRREIK